MLFAFVIPVLLGPKIKATGLSEESLSTARITHVPGSLSVRTSNRMILANSSNPRMQVKSSVQLRPLARHVQRMLEPARVTVRVSGSAWMRLRGAERWDRVQ